MPLTPAQNTDITAILTLLLTTTNQRKRRLSEVFLELVDKVAYPEYYEVSRYILCQCYSFLPYMLIKRQASSPSHSYDVGHPRTEMSEWHQAQLARGQVQ